LWNALSPFLFLGLGSLWHPVIYSRAKAPLYLFLYRSFCLGFLFHLSLAFFVRDLNTTLIASALVSILGVYFFLTGIDWKPTSKTRFLFFILLSVTYLARILLEPIQQWDARSVWFFQGKILFYQGAFGDIWDTKRFLFGNLDYPKLHALLAAQSANLAGFWNEYLPKTSLFLLLLPVFSFFTQQIKRNGYSLAFLLLALFVPGSLLWEGYMDGIFSLYAMMALYRFCKFVQEEDITNLLDGALAIGVALSLKNEGALFLTATFTAFLPLFFVFFSKYRKIFNETRLWLITGFVLFPFLYWFWQKYSLKIPSQMFLHPITLSEVFQRITWNSFSEILKSAAFHGKFLQGIGFFFLAVILGGWKFIISWNRSFTFLCFWIVSYFFGISAVLYSNSMELYLPQHLYYIMDRLMLTILQGLFVGILLFSDSEEKKRAS
jgi:hypothetical protein